MLQACLRACLQNMLQAILTADQRAHQTGRCPVFTSSLPAGLNITPKHSTFTDSTVAEKENIVG